jgi:hypothetical protein
MLTAQAPGAQVKPFLLTLNNECNRVNIGYPLAIGMAF